MNTQMWISLVAALGGVGGVAAIATFLVQLSYPRRLEASLARLKSARHLTEDEPHIRKAVDQQIRMDTLLLVAYRHHNPSAWRTLRWWALGLLVVLLVLLLALLYWLERGATGQLQEGNFDNVDLAFWTVLGMVLSYLAFAISLNRVESRQRQRRWAATILVFEPTQNLILNEELAQAKARMLRTRRYEKQWRNERERRLFGEVGLAKRSWAQARRRAIWRMKARRIGEFWIPVRVDNPKRWPYSTSGAGIEAGKISDPGAGELLR